MGCVVQVGALVWGTVRRVEPYGVFVGIENTRFSGLLHISSISRAHVESVEVPFIILLCTNGCPER